MGRNIRFALICSVLCSSLTWNQLRAQSEIGDAYLGLQVSPNFTYRVISNNTDDPEVDELIDFLNNREKAAFGFRIAAVAGVKAWKNWDFEAGISYVRNCTSLNLQSGELNPIGPVINIGGADEFDLETCYTYLGIPMRIIWNFGTEKTRILASFGLTPQILVNDEITRTAYLNGEEVDEQKTENTQDINGFNLSPQFGIGIQFTLGKNLMLRSEGIARFGVLNINEESAINSYLYSSELNVGLAYLIGKSDSAENSE